MTFEFLKHIISPDIVFHELIIGFIIGISFERFYLEKFKHIYVSKKSKKQKKEIRNLKNELKNINIIIEEKNLIIEQLMSQINDMQGEIDKRRKKRHLTYLDNQEDILGLDEFIKKTN